MRAQVFYGPGDLRFEEIPTPEPEPGGLVVRVDAALTCGTDVKTLRRGHPVMIPHVPTVFGHELAGVVTAVGRGASGAKEGDRIVAANSAPCGRCGLCAASRPNLCEDLLFVNGAYGEYIALPPRLVARNVVPIGPGLAASSAAFAEPLACALLGVERGRVEAGMTVVIWGHGPLGCLLALAAGLERGSEHPLAAAILAGAAARGVAAAPVDAFRSLTGRGVIGAAAGRRVALGNARLLEELGIDAGALGKRAEALREEGQTVMFLIAGDAVEGILGVADPIKASALRAIRDLQGEGLRVVMVTGDSGATARAVARTLGLDDVIAEVLPEQKAQIVRRFQAEGRVVAMAGDGVNDAPALAAADVGIAMGTGTDVAMESAGITLVRGDLGGIVRARRLSRATMRNIRQNLAWAFAYNVLGVPIAAGALYPFTDLLLNPMIASAAMSLSSVSVIANALRLRRAAL